ncbi:DUF4331 domain-containing protein [Hymenobacter jejuensis]|uniref:DUF4331 domain-containing protein n=1 Tax=Hymenobacter jejuensis TaxID=2502781 RepID=A0A5B8A0E9_9BACT|nr:DUF4331 domain-containing protein [Hymenobacter jejuensis]QDA60760.1 DUF4331 domain-containing protein [Hymenobacter jejuensis]
MVKLFTLPVFRVSLGAAIAIAGALAWGGQHPRVEASSHREAPLIADDPLADNTDLYAFRDPNNAEMINIIANYIPLELPQGGPNFNNFGENVRYEIHIKNGKSSDVNKDDITYRFTFTRTNEDPSTFFNIRLGKQNLKATYKLEQSLNGGASFTTLIPAGPVPPTNIGPRSISGAAGLGAADYNALITNAIQTVGTMKVFCGPVDDPFFTDLGSIFDIGGVRVAGSARDGLARKNTHTIAMQIPISTLQKAGKTGAAAANILDSDYIIGVWASASRPALRTLNADGTQTHTGDWVQVSRLGMPLLNEVINPVGSKDAWNAKTPYNENPVTEDYLSNPELGLYTAEGAGYYGTAVPGLAPLRIQRATLVTTTNPTGYDFANTKNGVSALLGSTATASTAFARVADGGFGEYLLRTGKPRSVDLLPIFHTGVPNLPPYQLSTGKAVGNPLSPGKPFINNFLPLIDGNPLAGGSVGGDMLRLNMAVPTTSRNSAAFSSEGLLAAAVLGLTVSPYKDSPNLEFIPNMDGFPNGRRLEDDVTRIELQAVGGIVLAVIGFPFEDNARLGSEIAFTTNVEKNDTLFKTAFPYEQSPWSGTKVQATVTSQRTASGLNLQPAPVRVAQNYPNPFTDQTTFHYEVGVKGPLTLTISDMTGRLIATVMKDKMHKPGAYDFTWRADKLGAGVYVATVSTGKTVLQSVKLVHQR